MRRTTTLSQDERAIEGLPIRLVIALVVGVASLAIMMQMIGGLGFNAQQEVTLEIRTGSLVEAGSSSPSDIEVTVVTEDGDPVPNAQVLMTSGTLTLEDNPVPMNDGSSGAATTGEDGELEHEVPCAVSSCSSGTQVDFRSDQDKGTIKFDIVTQGDGNYKDKKDNPTVVITQ
ncbi:hypothetical protein HZS55_00225 [Halosimplex rubrum]|uniref:Carboxypeptidase regulatory-like domain-containing protein n=1 Tax=Halosimplex rubrum TaxID=869889 RepID=A0A7D5P6J1_9EURY|nr:hypothetical protein [Halosimplex rubrum]QLH75820.1 hypothetical protein HZS55_00225 [Halosimplex rubrum]